MLLKYIFIFVGLSNMLFAQQQYPKDYFDNPLKIPLVFAGTFGELRSNHFHAGIDLKTQQKEGIPVYAPADGYVSRVKVKQRGYGKALYIKHPNGYSTVYAHLQSFNEPIQKYVKSIQYNIKSYTFNRYLKEGRFKIKKGELIGYTGNTGSSGGPHLHYEIRKTTTGDIINPMLFGLTTKDSKAPSIIKLMAFPLNATSRVNNSTIKTILPFKKRGKGIYVTEQITANGEIGFGVNVFDKQDLAVNKNGIFSLEMKLNGQRVYYHDLETFSFSESKYINLLIDYKQYAVNQLKYQKTHKVKHNVLSIYKDLVNDGRLLILPNMNYNVEIIAKDYHNNTTTVIIPIKGVVNNPIVMKKDTTAYKITRGVFTKFSKENVTVAFPKRTVYEDVYIDFNVSRDTVYLHKPIVPLDRKFTLTYIVSHLSPFQRDKVYIADVTDPKDPSFVFFRKKDHKIYATLKSFGTYTLKFDETPPAIRLVNFKDQEWVTLKETLDVAITDNETGVKDYRATIDGEWVLMEYDHKNDMLIYDFDDKLLTSGKHELRIEVVDNVGNVGTKSVTFFKKSE